MSAADGEERHLPPACCGPSPEVLRDALCNRFAAGDCLRPQSARGYAGGVHFSAAVVSHRSAICSPSRKSLADVPCALVAINRWSECIPGTSSARSRLCDRRTFRSRTVRRKHFYTLRKRFPLLDNCALPSTVRFGPGFSCRRGG